MTDDKPVDIGDEFDYTPGRWCVNALLDGYVQAELIDVDVYAYDDEPLSPDEVDRLLGREDLFTNGTVKWYRRTGGQE